MRGFVAGLFVVLLLGLARCSCDVQQVEGGAGAGITAAVNCGPGAVTDIQGAIHDGGDKWTRVVSSVLSTVGCAWAIEQAIQNEVAAHQSPLTAMSVPMEDGEEQRIAFARARALELRKREGSK